MRRYRVIAMRAALGGALMLAAQTASWAQAPGGMCAGDLVNVNGRYVCRQTPGNTAQALDYHRWSDGAGSSSGYATPRNAQPQNNNVQYFGGHNSLYGFGR